MINLSEKEGIKDFSTTGPIKIGVVLSDYLVWCFNDFEFYTIPLELSNDFFETTESDRKRGILKEHIHKYIEFTSIIIKKDKGTTKYITENAIDEFQFRENSYSKVIDFFFSNIDVPTIMNEMEHFVNKLDIDDIISSYKTYCYQRRHKLNSDTIEWETYVRRATTYTDAYISKLLPHKIFYSESPENYSSTAYPNPDDIFIKLHVDFIPLKKFYFIDKFLGEPYVDRLGIYNVPQNAQEEEYEIRNNAKLNYNRKDHIMTLVNQRIMSITSIKLDIESKYHIQEAIKLMHEYPIYKLYTRVNGELQFKRI